MAVVLAVLAPALASCAGGAASLEDGAGRGLVAATGPPPVDVAALDARVEAILDAHGDGVEASLWIGGASGPPWYEHAADVARPAASSIKPAYLIELFDRHAAALDEPLPGAAEVVADADHPAVAHFDADTRAEIREHLEDATVRQVGVAMIRGTDVSNAVYNAAANVTTAVFGGPESLTGWIHARDPDFADIDVRRYMLAARDVTGDNEATAASLAAVLQRMAQGRVSGVEAATVEAIREVMFLEKDPTRGRHYFKGGSLNSDPLTRVRSGWFETDGETLVYVVMVEQPHPAELARGEAGRLLAETVETLTEEALAQTWIRTESRPAVPASPSR